MVVDIVYMCHCCFVSLKWGRAPPGQTPLFFGTTFGHFEIVKYLVGMKANIEAKNYKGQNALYLANRDHRNDIVNFLRNDKEILKIRNAFDDEKKTSDHDELNPS